MNMTLERRKDRTKTLREAYASKQDLAIKLNKCRLSQIFKSKEFFPTQPNAANLVRALSTEEYESKLQRSLDDFLFLIRGTGEVTLLSEGISLLASLIEQHFTMETCERTQEQPQSEVDVDQFLRAEWIL